MHQGKTSGEGGFLYRCLEKREAEVVFSGDAVDSNVLMKAVDEAGYKASV